MKNIYKGGFIMASINYNLGLMRVVKVYPIYVAKAKKKGRTKEEVDEIIRWLTGYSQEQLDAHLETEINFNDFFSKAPQLNPTRTLIKGIYCGIGIDEIEESTMKELQYLNILIDELAKGETMGNILNRA